MFIKKNLLLKVYFLLIAVDSILAFYFLMAIPADSKEGVIAGYSLSRLLLLAGVISPFIMSVLILIIVSVSSLYLINFSKYIDMLTGDKLKYFCIATFSTFLMCFSLVFFLMPAGGDNFSAIHERLAPFVYFWGGVGMQTFLAQFYWCDQKIYLQNLKQWRSILIFAGIFFIFSLFIALWVFWSGIGLKPETYGWHTPGTPILFSQLLFGLLVWLSFILVKRYIRNSYQWRLGEKINISLSSNSIIFMMLWLSAFLIWQMEPLRKQSYFNPKPTPPNFEYYPYSDAAFYDGTSQSILIGEGRNLEVVLRPLYVFFLDVLHMIGGQNYDVIITFQVLCLAVMPGLVFLLVSLLGDQAVGVFSAILVIFREKNSIALTNILEVSHSKLLLSDLPTMLLMVLFVYTLVNWLKKESVDYSLGITAGAAFGFMVLVRSQSQLLLPVLLAGIAVIGGFQWRKAMSRILIFMLGLMVVVIPWIWRNYQVSGKPTVENTQFYIRLFAGGYSEPTDHVDIFPGESFDDYNKRIKSQIVQYFLNHPVEIGRVYASYFIHNEISSVIYLPMSLEFYSLRSYVDHLPFWSDPYIDLLNGYGIMFFINLGLILLGCAVAFERLGFLSLFPLIIHFAYSLSVVIARISGWRFILPIDWIFQIYYCLGLLQILVMIVSVLWNKNRIFDDSLATIDVGRSFAPSLFFQGKTYTALVFFLMIGLSLPLIELLTPVRYPPLSNSSLIKTFTSNQPLVNGEPITESALKYFLEAEEGATILYGRALYPSYYEKGIFWGDDNPNLLAASRFDRLQFNLIGPKNVFAFIPLLETPKYFPHASDVFLIGCLNESSVDALIVIVNDHMLTSSPWRGLSCSELE